MRGREISVCIGAMPGSRTIGAIGGDSEWQVARTGAHRGGRPEAVQAAAVPTAPAAVAAPGEPAPGEAAVVAPGEAAPGEAAVAAPGEAAAAGRDLPPRAVALEEA